MNTKLPIYDFADDIIRLVEDNPVVVITAETGSGKTTQVPQYLLAAGYSMVVTQPRRIATRTVAERVSYEIGESIGGTVGYRTAHERRDSIATQCLFATDGLALVRELFGRQKYDVLVLDEVHEWNLNMEVLLAWAKRQQSAGSSWKIVIMSATMDSDAIAEYYGGAPVLTVPGRTFPVDDYSHFYSRDKVRLINQLIDQGRNVLVFEPGKREIVDTINAIDNENAVLLPLHGQLDGPEQARCFKQYKRAKVVVATNVAQTSITIADIDAVVDCGTERRIELLDGVEGLFLRPISFADREQRKGRAGRCRPGVYYDMCPYADDDRPIDPVPEILRTRLDQTVLRLAKIGVDAAEVDFFHQPPKEEIESAKQSLELLGCLADGVVTAIGRRVAELPVSVKFGRMGIEADKRGVVDDVIKIAALMEEGGVTRNYTAWYKGEVESDAIAQLNAFDSANTKTKEEMYDAGIFIKGYFRVKERSAHIRKALSHKVKFGSTGERSDILKSIYVGMVETLYSASCGRYIRGDDYRQLDNQSVVSGRSSKLAVGVPFNVQTRRGGLLRLFGMVTMIDEKWCTELTPHLITKGPTIFRSYDPVSGYANVSNPLYIGDVQIGVEDVQEKGTHTCNNALIQILCSDTLPLGAPTEIWKIHAENKKRINKYFKLVVAVPEDDPLHPGWDTYVAYKRALNGATSYDEIDLKSMSLTVFSKAWEASVKGKFPADFKVGAASVTCVHCSGINSGYVEKTIIDGPLTSGDCAAVFDIMIKKPIRPLHTIIYNDCTFYSFSELERYVLNTVGAPHKSTELNATLDDLKSKFNTTR